MTIRSSDDPDDYDFVQHPSGVGYVQAITEYGKTPRGTPTRKRRMRRPIGFTADIDKLEPADD